jgi:hypothetical protein
MGKPAAFMRQTPFYHKELLLALIGQFLLQIIGDNPTKWQSLPNNLFLRFQNNWRTYEFISCREEY